MATFTILKLYRKSAPNVMYFDPEAVKIFTVLQGNASFIDLPCVCLCILCILAACRAVSYPDLVLFVPIFLEYCRQFVQSEETALVCISRLKKLFIVRHFFLQISPFCKNCAPTLILFACPQNTHNVLV